MQLSKLEYITYETLRKNNLSVFRIKDISLLINTGRTRAYNIIKSLKKKGAIETVRPGLYALKGTHEFVIGASLNWPSYLSFWSALNYYGLTDQMPKIIFFASTKYMKPVKNFRYVVLNTKRFFGYGTIGDMVIAEKEKAVIDSLLLPRYISSMRELYSGIESHLHELDIDKIIHYALRINSKAVIRRLGFILDECKIRKKQLELLSKNKGKGYELLDPTINKKNNFNKKWLLDINW